MRVLVCGGRDFADLPLFLRTMDALHKATPITAVIHGGARGADSMADNWVDARSLSGAAIVVRKYPADWARQGKAAGMLRNQEMLEHGKPDLVVAFPGGRGTADMVRRARAAGVEVREVEPIR